MVLLKIIKCIINNITLRSSVQDRFNERNDLSFTFKFTVIT